MTNMLFLFRQGFRFVLSPGPTTASSLYLAKRMKWASLEEKAKIEHVEVCPSALKLTAEIARRVGEDGGGALVDYGDNVIVSDSLQVSATSIR
jgi:NADH dehydrogenase [ubiquinone] 1 alpha subcomplex assembly factor 7